MSLTLLCNAAEGPLQIGLRRDDAVLCEQIWHSPQRGTEILAPALALIFERLDLRPADLTHLACVRGPGSFTGIRLTLTTAAALRRVNEALTAGLDYLQALARTALARDGALAGLSDGAPDAAVWVLTHARRNLVHCQPFGSDARPLAPVELLEPAAAVRRVAPGSRVTGSGLRRQPGLAEACAAAGAVVLPPEADLPSFAALWNLARDAPYAPADIEPLYVRPCDAVENLPQMARRQGVALDAARRDLQRLLTRPAVPVEEA